MRQHIANCVKSPEEAKVVVRMEQQRKDEDARVKKALQSRRKIEDDLAGDAFGESGRLDGSFAQQSVDTASITYAGISLPPLPLLTTHDSFNGAWCSRHVLQTRVYSRTTLDKLRLTLPQSTQASSIQKRKAQSHRVASGNHLAVLRKSASVARRKTPYRAT